MANLIHNESNVQFSNINQLQVLVNNKIGSYQYVLDEDGNIISNSPIINAIDIDWNNATADEITTPIKSTSDLIALLSSNKVNIKVNTEGIASLRNSIVEIQNAIENLDSKIGESDEILQIKTQLASAIDDITLLQTSNDDIINTITRLSETLVVVQTSIPKTVSDLLDGTDVLRSSSFETIKDELKGDSAFEIAKKVATENHTPFNYQNEAEWIASLKGDKGNNGASAYDIARQTALILGKEFPYNNEQEWITDIENATVAKEYTDQKVSALNNRISAVSSTILGELTENVEDPNTHEIINRIKQFTNSSGSLNGENWATSIEEINELLNKVSFALNVEDNAEPNKIDEIDFAEQDVSELTGKSTDTDVKFGISSLDNKNVGISVNIDLIKKIQENTINIAGNNANQKIVEALNTAKQYTDSKLSWSII